MYEEIIIVFVAVIVFLVIRTENSEIEIRKLFYGFLSLLFLLILIGYALVYYNDYSSFASNSILNITAANTPLFLDANNAISIYQASVMSNGFLSSSDWNAFNSMSAGGVANINGLTGVVNIEASTSNCIINTNSQNVLIDCQKGSGGGTTLMSNTPIFIDANNAISIYQASASSNGFLTSTDWNTFNSKLSTALLTAGTGLTVSGTQVSLLPLTAGTGISISSTNTISLAAPTQEVPANPTGTTSTAAYVMMGVGSLGGSSTKLGYTPIAGGSGKIMIVISGFAQSDTAKDGINIKLAYGSTTAPTNGAGATGTVIGPTISLTAAATSQKVNSPFFYNYYLTGLSAGTPYWIDFQVEATTGGTASISNIYAQIWGAG